MLILFPPSGALCGVGIAVLIAVCAFLKFLGCVANPREVSAVIMLPGCRVSARAPALGPGRACVPEKRFVLKLFSLI
jgi:hypothetical protein